MPTRTRTNIACAAAMTAALLASAGADAPAVAAAASRPTASITPGTTHRPAGVAAGRGGVLRPASNDHAIGRSAAPVNNRYFAGYQAAVATGSATVAAASFTVPALPCTTADLAISPDAGVAVNNYKTASVAGVITGCSNGTAVYFPFLVINGSETDYPKTPFAAGDTVDLITKVSTNRTSVQVTDVTKNLTTRLTGAGASANLGWIGDDSASNGSTLLGVPNFGKLTFGNCSIDYKALGGWHPQQVQRVNGSTVQITTGGFWPGGTAFTTHYQHS